jgi:hypothetical protein
LLNLLDPELLYPAARHAEIAHLLARGYLRYRLQCADDREKYLAFLRDPSHSWCEPSSEGENA